MARPVPERRRRRSIQHDSALRFQLESTMERGRMSALALADRSGLLLAWAGEDGVCKELGAMAPVMANGCSSTSSTAAPFTRPRWT